MTGPLDDPVHVLGCGAIGSVVATGLLRAGCDVVTVDEWPEHVQALARGDLHVEGPLGRESCPAHRSLTLDEWTGSTDTPRWVVLASKSEATGRYLSVLEGRLDADGVVASLQNGFNEPVIAERLGADRTLGAAVLMDARLAGADAVHQAETRRTIRLGPWGASDEGRHLHEALALAFDCPWDADIRGTVAGKLVRNCAINPVAAIADATIGEVTGDRELVEIAARLAREAVAVLVSQGYRPAHQVTFGLTSDEIASGPITTVVDAIRAALPPSLATVPSTLQDVRNRRRTEIDHLSGWVAETGDAPLTTAVVALVHAVEAGTLAPGDAGRAGLLGAAATPASPHKELT